MSHRLGTVDPLPVPRKWISLFMLILLLLLLLIWLII